MVDTATIYKGSRNKIGKGCLSCGTTEKIRTRRFCSIHCRQKLQYVLNVRTGLLHALNTQYATFHFSNQTIILNILPFGSEKIFTFSHPRTPGEKPASDFKTLCDFLGNRWWAEKKRTNRGYLASSSLLQLAQKKKLPIDEVRPETVQIPSVNQVAFTHLNLAISAANSSEFLSTVKRAYRQQAKANHPDLGGDAGNFRKIHHAYQELMQWGQNPTFKLRQSFPDKWFYSRHKDCWMQPTRYRKWER